MDGHQRLGSQINPDQIIDQEGEYCLLEGGVFCFELVLDEIEVGSDLNEHARVERHEVGERVLLREEIPTQRLLDLVTDLDIISCQEITQFRNNIVVLNSQMMLTYLLLYASVKEFLVLEDVVSELLVVVVAEFVGLEKEIILLVGLD